MSESDLQKIRLNQKKKIFDTIQSLVNNQKQNQNINKDFFSHIDVLKRISSEFELNIYKRNCKNGTELNLDGYISQISSKEFLESCNASIKSQSRHVMRIIEIANQRKPHQLFKINDSKSCVNLLSHYFRDKFHSIYKSIYTEEFEHIGKKNIEEPMLQCKD